MTGLRTILATISNLESAKPPSIGGLLFVLDLNLVCGHYRTLLDPQEGNYSPIEPLNLIEFPQQDTLSELIQL